VGTNDHRRPPTAEPEAGGGGRGATTWWQVSGSQYDGGVGGAGTTTWTRQTLFVDGSTTRVDGFRLRTGGTRRTDTDGGGSISTRKVYYDNLDRLTRTRAVRHHAERQPGGPAGDTLSDDRGRVSTGRFRYGVDAGGRARWANRADERHLVRTPPGGCSRTRPGPVRSSSPNAPTTAAWGGRLKRYIGYDLSETSYGRRRDGPPTTRCWSKWKPVFDGGEQRHPGHHAASLSQTRTGTGELGSPSSAQPKGPASPTSPTGRDGLLGAGWVATADYGTNGGYGALVAGRKTIPASVGQPSWCRGRSMDKRGDGADDHRPVPGWADLFRLRCGGGRKSGRYPQLSDGKQ